ncbi:MAG: ABC transporter permease [Ilumatobacteraceae bacterium]
MWHGIRWLFDPTNWSGDSGLWNRIAEHMWYSLLAMVVALVIALPAGLLIGHTGRGRFLAAGTANLLRAVPTFGIVGLIFIWRPFTLWPLILALAILAVPPIMINAAVGVAATDAQVRDAAEGIGLSGWQVLTRVEVPCATPLILAGVRSAANQVIATATILGFKGQGGLGRFIFSGFGTQQYFVVYGASIAVVVIVLAVEGGFAVIQRRIVSPGLRTQTMGNVTHRDGTGSHGTGSHGTGSRGTGSLVTGSHIKVSSNERII